MSQATAPVSAPGIGSKRAGESERISHQEALAWVEEALFKARQRCPELPVFAIRWMFIKHPLHPVLKSLMREAGWSGGAEEDSLQSNRGMVWRTLRCLLYGLQLSGRLWALRFKMRHELYDLKIRRFDLIAKTCRFGTQQAPEGSDFYYGELQKKATERGKRMLLLCSDVKDIDWTQFVEAQFSGGPMAVLPEWCLVHPFAPIRMALRQISASQKLRRLSQQARVPLEKEIFLLASRDCLLPDTAVNALNFWIAKGVVKTWRPKAFMTFYEGHAWERCAWWGARTADPSCKIIGYQHTAVFEASRSVTQPAVQGKERSLPDLVLCLGKGPAELMRGGLEPKGVKLIPVGSFRYQGAHSAGSADPGRRTVLVAPEGIRSEVKAIFSFALACAQEIPSYTFVLRCHPEIPMPDALKLVSEDLSRQPNIVFSEGKSLEEDCDRSSVLLSRGSSTVLYGILKGLMPVYGPVNNSMPDWDPLYKFRLWRAECETPREMAHALEAHEQAPKERREAEWEQALRYVQDYTGPVTDERMEAILNEI